MQNLTQLWCSLLNISIIGWINYIITYHNYIHLCNHTETTPTKGHSSQSVFFWPSSSVLNGKFTSCCFFTIADPSQRDDWNRLAQVFIIIPYKWCREHACRQEELLRRAKEKKISASEEQQAKRPMTTRIIKGEQSFAMLDFLGNLTLCLYSHVSYDCIKCKRYRTKYDCLFAYAHLCTSY